MPGGQSGTVKPATRSASLEDLSNQLNQVTRENRQFNEQVEGIENRLSEVTHRVNTVGGDFMLPESSKIRNHQLSIFEGNPDESFTEWYWIFPEVSSVAMLITAR